MTEKFVTLPREVVERAMSALEFSETQSHRHQYDVEASALAALSAALEQPQGEQEPVAWLHQCNKMPDLVKLSFSKREPVLTAKGYKAHPLIFGDIARQLPKREPLTEKDIQKLLVTGDYLTIAGLTKFARAIEAAHNIR